jgi:molybdopterin converting factor small subunit
LSIRTDLQEKVAQLKERIKESAKVQEGDEPCDNVEELYKELDEALVQLEDLIYRINITNVQIVQDGDSLTRLIANRDVLSIRVKALKEVVNYVAANDKSQRL